MELVDDFCRTHEPKNTNNLWARNTGYSDQRISHGNKIQIFLSFLTLLSTCGLLNRPLYLPYQDNYALNKNLMVQIASVSLKW